MLITNKLESLSKKQSLLLTIAIPIVGSILLALLARLSIPVPFSPVPITGQTFGVLILGGLLGSRLAVISVIFYIIEGMAGLPVFAGGSFGPLYLLGPTGGYLIGFIPAAFFIGNLTEKGWNKTLFGVFLNMTVGTAIIFGFGLAWLSVTAGISNAIAIGLIPYIPGAVIKITVAALLLYYTNKFTKQ